MFLSAIFFGLSGETTIGLDEAGINKLLAGPVTVVIKTGAAYKGNISAANRGDLRLQIQSGGGEAILTWQKEEIESVIFPGSSLISLSADFVREGDLVGALPLLDALYRQRINFLSYLSDSELLLLTSLSEASLQVGHPADAIAVSRNLLPYLKGEPIREKLHGFILLGHYRLGLLEEAKSLAAEWIEKRDLYGDSALGWWIRAQIDFEEENYKEALWTSLHPIVFSGQMPMEYLGACYAVAIAASHELQKDAKAGLLYGEMQNRGLDWPIEELFADYRLFYRKSTPLEKFPDAPDSQPNVK